MNIGDRVLIGGRTMLRPGFSLVGLEAVVMPTFPNAPEGCVTVQIDWNHAGYDEEKYDDLPPFINVPMAHLEPVTKTETTQPEAPALGFVEDRVLEDASETRVKDDDASSPEDSKPRLRLI